MPFFHRKLLPLCVAALLSGEAAAVGLGDIRLQSHLGRPLDAVIPLTHLGDLESDQIKVAIGSAEEYGRLGVDFDYQHTQLNLQPVIENGRGYVRVVTPQAVVEPYLNIVVTLRWPSGQLSREYTLLLDPPPSVAAPVAAAQSAPAASPASRPAAAPAGAARVPAPVTAPARLDDGRYLTARGDSLWRLAERLRPAGVPVAQMMSALHAANPDAFIGGDPGRLKEAVAIDVPDAAAIAAAPAAAPSGPRAAPAAASADRFAGRAVPGESSGAGASSEVAPDDGGGRLELVAPVDTEQLASENVALKAEVARLSGNVGELSGQLVRSEERLQQLEARLQQVLERYDAQRGAPAVNPPTAGSPFADGAAAAPAGESAAGVTAAAPIPAERDTPWWMHLAYWIAIGGLAGWALYQQSRARRPQALEAEAQIPAPVTVSPSVRVVPRAAVAPAAPAVHAAATPETTPEPATADEWGAQEENEHYWRHHRSEDEELPLDLVAQPPAPAGTFAAAASAGSASDEGVDASISAGVFLAFGRYQEAEQVLAEALQREPERSDLKLQLLDVYLQSDNRDAFDQLAVELEQSCAGQPELLAELAVLRESYSTR